MRCNGMGGVSEGGDILRRSSKRFGALCPTCAGAAAATAATGLIDAFRHIPLLFFDFPQTLLVISFLLR